MEGKSATACGTITRRSYLWIIEAIWERIKRGWFSDCSESFLSEMSGNYLEFIEEIKKEIRQQRISVV
jgi:hypothetical protein